jgi:surface antigen
MRSSFCIAAVFLAAGSWQLAAAADLKFVGATPLAYMSAEDGRAFRQAAVAALTDEADGKTIVWASADAKSRGEIKLIRSDDMHGPICRVVQIRTEATGHENRGVYRACRGDSGNWRLVVQGAAARKKKPGNAG